MKSHNVKKTSNVPLLPEDEFTKITYKIRESTLFLRAIWVYLSIKWGFAISPVSHQHKSSHGIIQVDDHMNVIFHLYIIQEFAFNPVKAESQEANFQEEQS